jgi:hypothetical protein
MWGRLASALLITCGVVALMGARRAQTPRGRTAPKWVQTAPPSEEFEAALPGTPDEGAEKFTVSGGKAALRYYVVSAGDTQYFVLAARAGDFPAEELAYSLMLQLCYKLVPAPPLYAGDEAGTAVRAEFRRGLRLGGHPGREYAIRIRRSAGLLRFYNTGRNYYAAVAVTAGKGNPLIDRFLDSFRLTAPTGSAGSGARAEPSSAPPARGADASGAVKRGAWFVILKTYPGRGGTDAAGRDAGLFRRVGLPAIVVRTDDYPNLKKGLVAVVLGPYSKAVARQYQVRARHSARAAYIKSGW